MKALGCRGVRRRLAAFHDGELSIAERAGVLAHLPACRRCTAELHALETVAQAIRVAAGARAVEPADLAGLRASIVGRLSAERAASFASLLGTLFEDMHLVWAGLGAAAFTAACVGFLIGLFYFGAAVERADSMAGMAETYRIRDGRMQLPRLPVEGVEHVIMPATVANAIDEAVFAFAADVTRDGRISNLMLLKARAGGEEKSLELKALLTGASRARFEPARFDNDPIAVHMVWLLAHTTVRAENTPSKLFLSSPSVPARRRGIVHRIDGADDDALRGGVFVEDELEPFDARIGNAVARIDPLPAVGVERVLDALNG